MTDIKQKLIELICSTEYGNSSLIGNNFQKGFIEKIADHIIASGYIEELQNEAYDVGVDSALHNHFGLSWEDAAGLRKEIARLQEATKWIPVTERLPKPFTPVLVYRQSFGTLPPYIKVDKMVLDYDDTQIWTDEVGNWKNVTTHWMPLPEPPKEDAQ